jgi:hypothetical protein
MQLRKYFFILLLFSLPLAVRSESLEDTFNGLGMISNSLAFTFSYEEGDYVKACKIGKKLNQFFDYYYNPKSPHYVQPSNGSVTNLDDLKFKIKDSCVRSNIIASKNLLQCVKYKAINFTCAGTANYDNCMSIRFGQNYSDFSEICSD